MASQFLTDERRSDRIRPRTRIAALKSAAACALLVSVLPAGAQTPVAPESQTPPKPPALTQRFSTPSQSYSASPREQTKLDITITAATDMNSDDKGHGAPILVRFYELRAEDVFASADYFSLQSNDKAILGSDLLTREEFIMRPGDVKTIRRKSHPDLAVIGVLAGYRDLGHADWRALQPLEPAPEASWYRFAIPANKAKLQVQLQASGVRITAIE